MVISKQKDGLKDLIRKIYFKKMEIWKLKSTILKMKKYAR